MGRALSDCRAGRGGFRGRDPRRIGRVRRRKSPARPPASPTGAQLWAERSAAMIDPVSEFLVTYPTTAKWLDDIINALLHEPRGTAHVHKLAHRDARRLSIDQ